MYQEQGAPSTSRDVATLIRLRFAPISLLFPNAPLQSLESTHQTFAQTAPLALKFPAEVSPFAAVRKNSAAAFRELHGLMQPGEATFVVTETCPATTLLAWEGPHLIQQFEWPADLAVPDRQMPASRLPEAAPIEPLTCADADGMVALTDLAFPGFFRPRTCAMGPYFGIRSADSGGLIAMCGERLNIETPHDGVFRELSGLCTHPAHRGHGYAQRLMAQLLQNHRDAGERSYLHVSSGNVHAAGLYAQMGFILRGEFALYRMTRR